MTPEAKEKIADMALQEIYEAFPWLDEKFGENGRIRTKEDNIHHLNYLETAYILKDEMYFTDYALWLENVLNSRNVSTNIIIDNFERLQRLISKHSFGEEKTYYSLYLEKGIICLKAKRS